MNRRPHTLPPLVIYLFMTIGLLSAIAFRLLTIIHRFDPALMRPVWYLGVVDGAGKSPPALPGTATAPAQRLAVVLRKMCVS